MVIMAKDEAAPRLYVGIFIISIMPYLRFWSELTVLIQHRKSINAVFSIALSITYKYRRFLHQLHFITNFTD